MFQDTGLGREPDQSPQLTKLLQAFASEDATPLNELSTTNETPALLSDIVNRLRVMRANDRCWTIATDLDAFIAAISIETVQPSNLKIVCCHRNSDVSNRLQEHSLMLMLNKIPDKVVLNVQFYCLLSFCGQEWGPRCRQLFMMCHRSYK